jgi:hypothetical protein
MYIKASDVYSPYPRYNWFCANERVLDSAVDYQLKFAAMENSRGIRKRERYEAEINLAGSIG